MVVILLDRSAERNQAPTARGNLNKPGLPASKSPLAYAGPQSPRRPDGVALRCLAPPRDASPQTPVYWRVRRRTRDRSATIPTPIPTPTPDTVRAALRQVPFEGGKDLVSLDLVPDVRVDGSSVRITLELPAPAFPAGPALANAIRTAIAALPGAPRADVTLTWRVREGETRRPRLPGVKNVIAVASGKGGVGKTTVAVNLAVGLAKLGASVGLMDLDIYGPNVPLALGSDEPAHVEDGDVLVPASARGVRFLSMAQLTPGDRPVLWRGPMLHKMVQQLASARWGELDYLLLDLPPGTGDVQLSVVQGMPLVGAIVVTTPQEIARIDARKGLAMFQGERIPILGIVENMAYYRCRQCDKEHEIFPQSAKPLGENVTTLARLPIDPSFAEGRGTVAVEGDGALAASLRDLAVATAAELARRTLTPNPFRVLA